MRTDDVVEILESNGLSTNVSRLKNDTGDQIRVSNGSIINCFDSGKLNYQGRNVDEVKAILNHLRPEVKEASPTYKIGNRNVFVVYGHDNTARTQLEAMLRRWGLEPLIIDQLPTEGQTIIEKLENYTDKVAFGVVLATPDDMGHRVDHPDEIAFRARQNVVLELGMLLSKLGRAKVAILIKEPAQMERPSDIQGLIYIPFNENVEEAKVQLAKELGKQGIDIPVSKL